MSRKSAPKTKSSYHHGDLRAELIQATRALLATQDAGTLSIADACRQAGVSTAAPYRHFSGKDDLLEAVAIDGISRMAEQMAKGLSQATPGTNEAIAALGDAYIQFARAEPNLFRLVFRPCPDPERASRMGAAGDRPYGLLLGEIARRLGAPATDQGVLDRALPLWAFVHGTASLLIDGKLNDAEMPADYDGWIMKVTGQLLAGVPETSGDE